MPSQTTINKYAGTGLEKLILLKTWSTDQPQLFILGLPRSGTTLVYQYIVHRLDVAYFTHGDGLYHTFPLTASLLTRLIRGSYQSDFTSDYGKSKGPVAPHEAGGFWNRHLGADDYIQFDAINEKSRQRLRQTVFALQTLSGGKPFVNKNVKHLLRIDALSQLFPQALFLIVERDLNDVALSILRGRYKNLRDASQWWSVRPPDYQAIKDLQPAEQVARQVISLNQRLASDLKQINQERILRVSYEDFCIHPDMLINLLETPLAEHERRNSPKPAFDMVHNEPRTPEENRLIEELSHAKQR